MLEIGSWVCFGFDQLGQEMDGWQLSIAFSTRYVFGKMVGKNVLQNHISVDQSLDTGRCKLAINCKMSLHPQRVQ